MDKQTLINVHRTTRKTNAFTISNRDPNEPYAKAGADRHGLSKEDRQKVEELKDKQLYPDEEELWW